MRDVNRIKPILNELERIWLDVPDQRFGQLLQNTLSTIAKENNFKDIFFIEDDKWLKWLSDFKIKEE